MSYLQRSLQGRTDFCCSYKCKCTNVNRIYLIVDVFLPRSGKGVLLEGKLVDFSRHAISDDSNQKVQLGTNSQGILTAASLCLIMKMS